VSIGNNAKQFPPFSEEACFVAPLDPSVRTFSLRVKRSLSVGQPRGSLRQKRGFRAARQQAVGWSSAEASDAEGVLKILLANYSKVSRRKQKYL